MKRWVKRYIREHGADPAFVREAYTTMGMTDDEYEAALREVLTVHVSVTVSGTNAA